MKGIAERMKGIIADEEDENEPARGGELRCRGESNKEVEGVKADEDGLSSNDERSSDADNNQACRHKCSERDYGS